MGKQNNIFLIGPMGAGKTSIAQQLSILSCLPAFDTDKEIEARTGVSINWIFQIESEAGFRQREADVIDELTHKDNIILSTGGGSIVTPENCERLKARGFVAYLTVDIEIQFERTKRHRGHRPLIDYPDARQRLEKLNKEREPLYSQIADSVYCTNHHSPRAIAKQILKDFRKYPGYV